MNITTVIAVYAALSDKEVRLKKELAELRSDYARLEGAVEEGIRDRYVRLRKQRGASTVVGGGGLPLLMTRSIRVPAGTVGMSVPPSLIRSAALRRSKATAFSIESQVSQRLPGPRLEWGSNNGHPTYIRKSAPISRKSHGERSRALGKPVIDTLMISCARAFA